MIESGTPAGIAVEWAAPTAAFLLLLLLASGRGERLVNLLASDARAAGVWIATRPLYAVLLWCLWGSNLPDDMWAWERFTGWMAQGLLPGRDFHNNYGPLFHYLQHVGRVLTPDFHKVGTLWIFLVGDALAVFAGGKVAAAVLGERSGLLVRSYLLFDPLLWHQLVVRAQDEPMFLGFLCLAVLLLLRGRVLAMVAVLALGLCATKITFAPYALALLLSARGDLRSAVARFALFGGITALGLMAYLATGASLVSETQMRYQNLNWGVGISVTDSVRIPFQVLPLSFGLAVYAVACATLVPLWCWRLAGHPVAVRAVLSVAATHSLSLLFMPCALTTYVTQGVAFSLLAVFLCIKEGRVRVLALVIAATVSWFVVMHWTKFRVFSIPQKPLAITWNCALLWLLWTRGPVACSGRDDAGVSPT